MNQQRAEPDFAQRGFDARAADILIAEADVRFQCAGKQERILQHDAELPAQLVHVVAAMSTPSSRISPSQNSIPLLRIAPMCMNCANRYGLPIRSLFEVAGSLFYIQSLFFPPKERANSQVLQYVPEGTGTIYTPSTRYAPTLFIRTIRIAFSELWPYGMLHRASHQHYLCCMSLCAMHRLYF